ncbi:restriction endonuclease subunit S [Aeromonas veronii]|uniref:restriction endonuclease subunit S n=1 Tax=Aeromonas veronii TaxID=654 RepID=UPI00211D87BB|nr:restriction endonuclease subunit S [Aeromonas veronii]UUM67584.1 restriction endonuclease subunit S [Aeromonas veronii]
MAEQIMQNAAGKTIPAGYKQTEVGVIPEDWSVLAISDRHEIATGNTPPTADACNYGADYLFIGPGDLGSGKYVFSSMKMLSSKGFKLARKFPAGSTLFTCIGSTIGKTGYVVDVATSNQQINAVFPNELDDSEFTYYALTNIAPKVKELAGEQAVPLVNKKDFGEMKYCLPANKQEQTAIANVLSDSDALIDALEQLIAKKQAIKSATMQQLLTGRTRLPAFALRPDGTPKGYKPSELGEIPEDWEFVCFGDIARPSSSRVNPKVNGGSDFCIELEHIESGTGDILGNTITNSSSSIKTIFCPSDVLFGKLRSYLRKFWFASCAGVCSTEIWVLKTDNKLAVSRYVYYIVQLDEFIDAASEAYGTHMPRADWGVVKEFPVLMPSIIEQTAIATILSDMDNELQALTQKLEKAHALKQGMMQQLLTGKIRLPLAAGA